MLMRTGKQPSPTDKHVGARVRMRRLQLQLSQEKLAEGLGLTFQQVQKYEKGTNRIGASRLQAIANILKVTPQFFFEDAPGQARAEKTGGPSTDFIDSFMSSKRGLVLMKAFEAIDDKLQQRIVALVEQMAENVA